MERNTQSGPTVPPNFTLCLQKTGANGFDLTKSQNGKVLYKVNFSASPDGKTLTEPSGAVATNEKFKVLFDRQRVLRTIRLTAASIYLTMLA